MWFQDYVKYDGHDVKPVRIFLSGSGGRYLLVKAISQAISKRLLYHCKGPKTRQFL